MVYNKKAQKLRPNWLNRLNYLKVEENRIKKEKEKERKKKKNCRDGPKRLRTPIFSLSKYVSILFPSLNYKNRKNNDRRGEHMRTAHRIECNL